MYRRTGSSMRTIAFACGTVFCTNYIINICMRFLSSRGKKSNRISVANKRKEFRAIFWHRFHACSWWIFALLFTNLGYFKNISYFMMPKVSIQLNQQDFFKLFSWKYRIPFNLACESNKMNWILQLLLKHFPLKSTKIVWAECSHGLWCTERLSCFQSIDFFRTLSKCFYSNDLNSS